MFDIGFSELIVIALVALIVIGPERLPRVARTAGALLGRFQRYVNEVKSEVRREMEIDDLRKFQSELTDQVREVEQTIHKELHSAEDVARAALAEAEGTAVSSDAIANTSPAAETAATQPAIAEPVPTATADTTKSA
jgi:sec-independent protein translocase protein TatB